MKLLTGTILLSLVSLYLAANTLPLREIRQSFLLPSQLPPYASSNLLDLIFYTGAGRNYVFNLQLQTGQPLFTEMADSCESSTTPSLSSRLIVTDTFSYYYCYAKNSIYVLDFYQDFAIISTLSPSAPLRANSVLQSAGLNDTDFVVLLSWDTTGSELIYINCSSNLITTQQAVSGLQGEPLINFVYINETNYAATTRSSTSNRELYFLTFWGAAQPVLLTSFTSSDLFVDQLTLSFTKGLLLFVPVASGSANLTIYSLNANQIIGSVSSIELITSTYNNITWSQAVFSPSFESDNFYIYYQNSLAVFHPSIEQLTPISQTPLPYISQIGAITNGQMYVVNQAEEVVYLQLGNYLYITTNVNVTSINMFPSSNIFESSFIYGSNVSCILTHNSLLTYSSAGQILNAIFMSFTSYYKDNLAPQNFWYLSTTGSLYQYNILTNALTLFQSFPGNSYQFVANQINGTVAAVSGQTGFLSCNKKTVFTFNLASIPNLPILYSKESQITLFPNCGATPRVVVIVSGCNYTTCSSPMAVDFTGSNTYNMYEAEKDSSYISQMDANTLVALESDFLNGNTITVYNPFTYKTSSYQANVEDVLLVNAFAYPLINGGAYVYFVYQDDLENVYFGITSQYIQYQTLLSQPNEFNPTTTQIVYSGAGTNSFTLSQTGLYTSITYYQIISL